MQVHIGVYFNLIHFVNDKREMCEHVFTAFGSLVGLTLLSLKMNR